MGGVSAKLVETTWLKTAENGQVSGEGRVVIFWYTIRIVLPSIDLNASSSVQDRLSSPFANINQTAQKPPGSAITLPSISHPLRAQHLMGLSMA